MLGVTAKQFSLCNKSRKHSLGCFGHVEVKDWLPNDVHCSRTGHTADCCPLKIYSDLDVVEDIGEDEADENLQRSRTKEDVKKEEICTFGIFIGLTKEEDRTHHEAMCPFVFGTLVTCTGITEWNRARHCRCQQPFSEIPPPPQTPTALEL